MKALAILLALTFPVQAQTGAILFVVCGDVYFMMTPKGLFTIDPPAPPKIIAKTIKELNGLDVLIVKSPSADCKGRYGI